MSGILEQMEQRIARLEQLAAQAQNVQQQPNTVQNAAGGLTGGGLVMGQQQAQPNVTDQMIVELATKIVANEGAKQAALGLLASMGIAQLPDTRPDQYPQLYAGLQQIERQFFGGGQQAQQGNALGGLGGFGGGQAQNAQQAGGANPGII